MSLVSAVNSDIPVLTSIPANAVARVENLEFLENVVPRTTTFKQFKQKQVKDVLTAANGAPAGQGTLDTHLDAKEPQATNGASHDAMEVDGPEDSEEMKDSSKPKPQWGASSSGTTNMSNM